MRPSGVARNLSPRQAKGNPGTLCPGVGAQRRQEEGERFTFAHCWNTSSWLGAESGAGLPQTPPDLILASENSEWDGYLNSRHLPQLPGTRSALLPLDLWGQGFDPPAPKPFWQGFFNLVSHILQSPKAGWWSAYNSHTP